MEANFKKETNILWYPIQGLRLVRARATLKADFAIIRDRL